MSVELREEYSRIGKARFIDRLSKKLDNEQKGICSFLQEELWLWLDWLEGLGKYVYYPKGQSFDLSKYPQKDLTEPETPLLAKLLGIEIKLLGSVKSSSSEQKRELNAERCRRWRLKHGKT